MSIGGIGSSNFLTYMKQNSQTLNTLLNELASGSSLSSGENPSAQSIYESLSSDVNGLNTANSGIDLAQGALSVADGALSQTSDQLQQLEGLAVQAANGTLSNSDRANLQNQFDQILGGIDSISQNTNFNGQNLLDGSFSQSVQTGPNAGDTTNVSLPSVSSTALGLNGAGISTQAAAQNALTAIQNAMSQVSSAQATVGSYESSLSSASEVNSTEAINLDQARSTIGDTDISSVMSQLSSASVQQQALISVEKAQLDSQQQLAKKLFG